MSIGLHADQSVGFNSELNLIQGPMVLAFLRFGSRARAQCSGARNRNRERVDGIPRVIVMVRMTEQGSQSKVDKRRVVHGRRITQSSGLVSITSTRPDRQKVHIAANKLPPQESQFGDSPASCVSPAASCIRCIHSDLVFSVNPTAAVFNGFVTPLSHVFRNGGMSISKTRSEQYSIRPLRFPE